MATRRTRRSLDLTAVQPCCSTAWFYNVRVAWTWRQIVPPKLCHLTTKIHGVTFGKIFNPYILNRKNTKCHNDRHFKHKLRRHTKGLQKALAAVGTNRSDWFNISCQYPSYTEEKWIVLSLKFWFLLECLTFVRNTAIHGPNYTGSKNIIQYTLVICTS